MLKIGPHISKQDTPHIQRQQARAHGWGVVQTFAGSPQRLSLDPDKVIISDNDGRQDVIWVVHSAYTALFVPPAHVEKATAVYNLNLAKWCQRAGASFAVIHLGGTKDRNPVDVVDAAKKYWATQTDLHKFLRENKIKFLIENVAAAYPTNQDLRHIISITKETPDILGWCLDTAHSNAAGIHYDVLQEILRDPNRRPDVIHCNYPGSPFLSGRDRHGWLYKDETPVDEEVKQLWKEAVKVAYRAGIPLVVEGSSNPGSLEDEVEALALLCEGSPQGTQCENSPAVNDAAEFNSPG